jgi:hypothetical protein
MNRPLHLSLLCVFALALAAVGASAQPNTLTQEEIEHGWILLWDGYTDFGWEWHGDANWTFDDGVLAAKAGQAGWLGTKATFGDFHLALEFRTAADGNSGVFLRSARDGEPHRTGYELQIYDNQPDGFNTGSLVFYQKAPPAKLIPDQWNQYHVFAQGDHFLIILNGRILFDGKDASHAAGVIGLQFNPDKPIEFRNLKLRPLGMDPLMTGRDLEGWKLVDRPARPGNHRWSLRDGGVLHVEGGPGQLETEKQFKNLVLQLDVRTNPPSPDRHPNSGVFLRGRPGEFWSGYESQIRNEYANGDITQPVDFGTGGVYHQQPARGIVAADGEWFTKTIVAYGRHVATWVNGAQVSSFDDPQPEGKNPRKQAMLGAGVISLQAHDPTTNLDFRNIKAAEIVERPDSAPRTR